MKPSCCDPFGRQRGGFTKAGDAVTPRWRLTSTQSGLAASCGSAFGFPWNHKLNPGASRLKVEARRRRHTRSPRKRFIERLRE